MNLLHSLYFRSQFVTQFDRESQGSKNSKELKPPTCSNFINCMTILVYKDEFIDDMRKSLKDLSKMGI